MSGTRLSGQWSAGVGYVTVLVAMPAGLLWWSPVPGVVPDEARLSDWVTQPVTVDAVNGMVSLVLWAAWLFLVYLVLAMAARMILRLRIPVPRFALRFPAMMTATAGLAVAAVPTAAHAAAVHTAPAPTSAARAASPVIRVNAAPARATYVVKRDDSLSEIARACLGDADRWPEIYHLNRGRHFPTIGGTLTDPDVIYPGWTLYLPDDAHGPHTGHPPPTNGRPTNVEPTPPPAPAPTRTGIGQPSPGAATTATPSGPATAPAPVPQSHDGAAPAVRPSPDPDAAAATDANGVDLPGGWVGLAFAAAIAAAVTRVWLHRRHRHVPAPLALPAFDDPDLRPLPPAATMMRRAIRSRTPQPFEPAPALESTPTIATAASAPPDSPAAVAGLGDRFATTGLALVGPGADSAARALFVAYLTDSRHRGEVIATDEVLDRLFDGVATQVSGIAGVTVTRDLARALTRVEEAIIHRRRHLDDEEADAGTGDSTMTAPTLLLTLPPTPTTTGRLATSSRLATGVRIDTVVLGDWPDGDLVAVAADGTCDSGERAATLGAADAIDLLGVAHEARTGELPAVATPPSDIKPQPAVAARRTTITRNAQRPGTKVQLVVLGRPAVLDQHGQPVPGLRGGAGHIMVYLAVHHGPADLNDIMAAMWPEARLAPARDSLYADISDLRRCIRLAAGSTAVKGVVKRGQTYELDGDLVDVDIWRVSRRLKEAALATDRDTKIAALADAVAAHRGELAEDEDWDGAEPAREQIRRHGVLARMSLAELLAGSDPQRCAELIEQAVTADPYSETVAQQAMRILAALGDTAAVEEHLDRLRLALRDIDLEPSLATVDLAAHLSRRPAMRGRSHAIQPGD